MKKIVLILLSFLIIGLLYLNNQSLNNNVVSIKTNTNTLNGFVYSYDTNSSYIITCFHGVCDDEEIYVENNHATLIDYDPYLDLALLKVNKKIKKNINTHTIQNNDSIYILYKDNNKVNKKEGYILDYDYLITNSIIYNNEIIDYKTNLIKLDLDAKKGYSGAPIYLNKDIVGMITMKDEEYTYGISSSKINEFVLKVMKGESLND